MRRDVAHMTAEARRGADVPRHPPTRVFLKKRLQMIENKRRDLEKEGKEAAIVWEQRA